MISFPVFLPVSFSPCFSIPPEEERCVRVWLRGVPAFLVLWSAFLFDFAFFLVIYVPSFISPFSLSSAWSRKLRVNKVCRGARQRTETQRNTENRHRRTGETRGERGTRFGQITPTETEQRQTDVDKTNRARQSRTGNER